MYDFCPLELFSGNLDRMRASIESLIRDPHRNLRIFVDGNVVHEEDVILTRDQLDAICFPNQSFANIDVLVTAVIFYMYVNLIIFCLFFRLLVFWQEFLTIKAKTFIYKKVVYFLIYCKLKKLILLVLYALTIIFVIYHIVFR